MVKHAVTPDDFRNRSANTSRWKIEISPPAGPYSELYRQNSGLNQNGRTFLAATDISPHASGFIGGHYDDEN
jgi:hypothetical protein